MINTITSKDNGRVKAALKLKESKYRKESGLFLAEGFKALEMALKNHQVVEVFSLEWIELPEDVNLYLVSESILNKLSNSVNPEGVVFVAKMRLIENRDFNRILYLDHISDPGNMGTLIRTALAFNYEAVVLSKECVSAYNDKVIAASKGAIFEIPVYEDELKHYKGTHHIYVSTLAKDSIPLEEVKLKDKFVLVLGNESHGVSKDVLSLADSKVIIPIQNIDSLNVALAGAILMYKIK